MNRTSRYLLVVPALALLLAVGCSDDDAPDVARTGELPEATTTSTTAASSTTAAGADAGGTTPSEVTVVARNVAFDNTALTATVGAPLTINFDNQDQGISHNLHVLGSGPTDQATPIAPGPSQGTVQVTFTEPGEIDFRCDVHPSAMTGTISVAG